MKTVAFQMPLPTTSPWSWYMALVSMVVGNHSASATWLALTCFLQLDSDP